MISHLKCKNNFVKWYTAAAKVHTVIEETIEIVFPDSQIVLQSKFS